MYDVFIGLPRQKEVSHNQIAVFGERNQCNVFGDRTALATRLAAFLRAHPFLLFPLAKMAKWYAHSNNIPIRTTMLRKHIERVFKTYDDSLFWSK